MGVADRPHSSSASASSGKTSHHRRPLSLAEAPLTTASTANTTTATTATTPSSSIFRTLPSSKKNKRKASIPPYCLTEEEAPSPCKSGQRILRGQSESGEQGKYSPDSANATLATSPAPTAAQLPPGHFLGRALNEDDSGDEQIREEICDLASRFQSAPVVLSSPSLSAIFLNYLLLQNHELAPTLFYLVAKHYAWTQTHSKELNKDYLRVLMEIYTTFLNEKSPFYVKVDSVTLQQMEESALSKDTAKVFEGCCAAVLPQIQAQVDRLNKDIRHGLDTWKPLESFDLTVIHSREEELSIYEMIVSPRVNDLQRIIGGLTPPQTGGHLSITSPFTSATSAIVSWLSAVSTATENPPEQLAAALCASLVSTYRYFSVSAVVPTSTASASASASTSLPDTPAEDIVLGSAPTCPSTPAPPQHSFRKTLFAKSIENLAAASTQMAGSTSLSSTNFSGSISSSLTTIGTTNWDKLPSFNAKLKSKSSNALFGSWKTKHSQKGHSLQERVFDRTVECSVCGGLIWGLAPQGLSCQACDVNVHHRCKTGLRDACAKDSKSSGSNRGSISNVMIGTSGSPSAGASSTTARGGNTTSPASLSHYPSPPESANVPGGNFNSPLEDTAGGGGGRSDGGGSFGLAASTEDIFHSRDSRFNEVNEENTSSSPLQKPSTSPSDFIISNTGIEEDAKVKRSNSGFSHTHHRGGVQTGLTSPEPISLSRTNSSKTPLHLMRSSSQLVRKRNSVRRHLVSSTLNLAGYVRNVKQKLDNHSYSGTAVALSKHTTSLMQLPIMTDRDLRRSVGPQTHSSSSAAAMSPALNVPELLPNWSGDPEMGVSESFEAAAELRIHFPNYDIPTKGPRVQDHVRTLVLLEFHQKVRYMVCYLKQFDYLLLQRWPKEHQRLADLMALDRIPRLIRLFRSLVQAIEGTLKPQGYGSMAETVLTWLSRDEEANLKAWVRDCQALSCTNMLDSVKSTVREYARKHPDIQPVLETRFNKFVLIEGLSQVRILYFNLPLIANNIMKDLEKKTSSYRAEAKIWKEIHAKLASIPHSIDKVCMPLVKLINDGHFFSTVDKGEQLTRHQAQGGNLPFADLLLQFPRTLFRYWVIDHSEIAVDKLTFTSDNKINYDYVKERMEVLAVLLDSALVLLVKDGGRFGLRPFKPTKEPGLENITSSTSTTTSVNSAQPLVAPNLLGNTMKLSPVFSTDCVFASLGEQIGHEYMLNMIFKEQAILLRLSFSSSETRGRWLNILKKREEVSNRRYLATQKARASLPPLNMHRSGETEADNAALSKTQASKDVVKTASNPDASDTMGEAEFLADQSSPEAIMRQILDFTGKISEVEQDLHALVQSLSNNEQLDPDEIFQKLYLKPGGSVTHFNRELMTVELLLTEGWLKVVNKHLQLLSRSPRWILEKRGDSNITTIANGKSHRRSKSAFVIAPTGPTDRRRRSRTRSGSIYRDCLEQAMSKSSLCGSVEGLPSEGGKMTEVKCDEGDTRTSGRLQLVERLNGLRKLVETTSLVASLALSTLETTEGEGEEDVKSDDDQAEAFLDANSSLSSLSASTSSAAASADRCEEMQNTDSQNGQKVGLEDSLASDYEVEEDEKKMEGPEGQELSEMDEYAETQLKEPVLNLDDDLIVPDTPLAKEEEAEDEEEEEEGDSDESYNDALRLMAQQLVDDAIDSAETYEMDLEMIACDLTNSAIAAAIAQVLDIRQCDLTFPCTTDSGISVVETRGHFSSGDDDELTVTGSRPHLAPTSNVANASDVLFSDLDKLDPAHPSLHVGVSVGRNDSQKSTTSSGYLGSGDEIVQHDWI